MAAERTTARLRKAFKYPSDSDSDDLPHDLDEEEQDKIVANLIAEDASKSALYLKCFLALPLLCILPYLVTMSTSPLSSFMCISSLLGTAVVMLMVPLPPKNDFITKIALELDGRPMQKFLVPINGVLAGVLAIGALLKWARGMHTVEDVTLEMLPAGIFCVAMFARAQLHPVGADELSKLKYDYKGA